MKKTITYLTFIVILGTSCKTVKEGIITQKWHEEAVSSMSVTMTGKIMIPVYLFDVEDFVVKIEGVNKREKLNTQNYYVSKVAFDTLNIGHRFFATKDCYTKDKQVGK